MISYPGKLFVPAGVGNGDIPVAIGEHDPWPRPSELAQIKRDVARFNGVAVAQLERPAGVVARSRHRLLFLVPRSAHVSEGSVTNSLMKCQMKAAA